MYMLMSLDRHYDHGFGVTADSFREAADRLIGSEEIKRALRLPINFLYRHAVELYLKAIIVVLSRRLKLPEYSSSGLVRFQVGSDTKKLHDIHSVKVLFEQYLAVVTVHKSKIASLGKRADWSEVPKELADWVEAIEKTDPTSTTFRYPITRNAEIDHEKSVFKHRRLEDITAQVQAGEKPVKVMLLVNKDDAIVDSFQLDEGAHQEISEVLRKTTRLLSGIHFGMRMEITGGT